jgi:ADP-ribose pyrophosphatase
MDNDKDIRVIRRETSFKKYLGIETYDIAHRRFDGGWMEIRREVLRRGAAVGALLYDPDRDALVMIEQFRIGPYVTGRPAWMTEIVAGLVKPDEDPVEVARRETEEEAGCQVTDLFPVYDYVVSPGCMDETVAIYCGRVDSTKAGGHFGLPHEGEDIRVRVLAVDLALAELEQGKMGNSLTIIALLWIRLNREKLRQRWLAGSVPTR